LNEVSRHLSNKGGEGGKEENDKGARRQAAVMHLHKLTDFCLEN